MNEVSDVEIAWLTGFWDGEGHISVHCTTERRWFQATTGLRNTHLTSMIQVRDILDRAGVKYHFRSEDRRPTNKLSYWLNVSGMENLVKLLQLMEPYWITKRIQADYLLEYCISRLKAKPKTGYSDREREIQYAFTYLNKRGKVA